MASFASQTSSSQSSAYSEFCAGVTATLRRWSALRAAVDGMWGGVDSHQKAENLRQGLIGMYFGPGAKKNVEPMDVEDALFIHMEEEFSCQLEDGSPKDLASIVHEMASRCAKGDFSSSREMVEYAEKEREELERNKPPVVLTEGGDDDDEDMDMGEEDDMGAATSASTTFNTTTTTTTTSTGASSMDYASYAQGILFGGDPAAIQRLNPPPARQLGEEAQEKPKPVLDDDGFEAVVPRRSRRKNKGQIGGS